MVKKKRYRDKQVMAVSSGYGTLAIPLDDVIHALGSSELTRYRDAIGRLGLDHACYDVPLFPRGTVKMVDRTAVMALLEDEGTPAARAFEDWLDREFPQPAQPAEADLVAKEARLVACLMLDGGASADTVIEDLQIPVERASAIAARAAILYGQMRAK